MPAATLLERERELAEISAALKRASRGHGQALIVDGPAGIGKTALLEAARADAQRRGALVLSARGGEYELEFPFGMVRQLFEPALTSLADQDRARVLDGAAELAASLLGTGGPTEFAGEDRSFTMLHGLYWLTANLAERQPVAALIDDVQWADAASMRFLHYLVRRLDGLAVTVVISARPGETGAAPSFMTRLGAEPEVTRLRPEPLSDAAVATLITRVFGESPAPEFTTACVASTGGTPFLVHQLLRALHDDGALPTSAAAQRIPQIGPSTVAHATLLRLSRLPESAVALAQAVAVLGPAAEIRRAAELADIEASVALRDADTLVAIGLLAGGSPLAFTHPIVRAAVHEDLGAGNRAVLHERAADLLTREGGDPDAIAGHLLLAAPLGRADVAQRLRAAASGAVARGAPEHAIAYLTRAVAEGLDAAARAEVLVELAEAARLISPQQAIQHLEEVLRLAEDPVLRARATASLAVILAFSGRWQQTFDVVEAALAELGEQSRELAVMLEGFVAAIAAYDPRYAEQFDRRRERLLRALEDDVPTAGGPALLVACVDALRAERVAEAADLALRCLARPGLLDDEREIGLIPQGLSVLIYNDRIEEAEGVTQRLLASARRRGSLQGYLVGLACLGWFEARCGELIAAEADMQTVLELAQEHGLLFVMPAALSYSIDIAIERPEADAMVALTMALELPPDFARTASGAMILLARGQLKHARGDRDGAIADLRGCAAIFESLRFENPNVYAWRSALGLALADTSPEEAIALVAHELEIARSVGQQRGIGVSLRGLGLLLGGERGLAALRESTEVLAASPARLEHARALVELGAATRRAGQRRQAREHLGAGLELARGCGAVRLAERAREELRASGARPRRDVRSGAAALTPSELRVAKMAAEGMSNPEIGQALFITRNTVETHMRNVLRKLGIDSRAKIAAALAGETADPP